jgi:hypothetical protein
MSSIARPAHLLKAEKTLTIPRHFIFFDTETTQTEQPDRSVLQTFKLGWAVYYCRPYGKHATIEDWRFLSKAADFWGFVFDHAEPKQRLWIIARNIVFDFTVCGGWAALKEEGYKLEFFHNNGVSVIVTVKKGSSTIVFLDSMNWFTESLAETGKRIGLPKMEIDFATCTIEQLSVYCKNDVQIEFKNFLIFIAFLEDNTIARLCYTKASTAMAAYLLRHYHTPIYIHNNWEALRLERDSYKGGRCECFFIGEIYGENLYTLDVNSLYPFVMQGNSYPVKYKEVRHSLCGQDLQTIIRHNAVVAKVAIDTPEPVYAVKSSRTIFPVGKFVTTLCTPELRYALQHRHVKAVLDCYVYEQADIFTSYVTTMYAIRKRFKADGQREYETICKYLLNSLYGKFGQKAEKWKKIGEAPNERDRTEYVFDAVTNKRSKLMYFLGEVFTVVGYGEAYNSFPAIAAHVTAYARMYLWHLMQVCGVGNYFYCDTDSLMVNEVGLSNLSGYLDATELGKLKIESRFNHLIIRGLKDYETAEKVVVKGISKRAVKLSEGVYEQDSWPTFRGLFHTTDVNAYTVHKVTKHLSREYTKGTVGTSGIVSPFVKSEGV